MHSESNSLWKRWGTGSFILLGLILVLRLAWIGVSSIRTGRAETQEEFRAKIQKIHDNERASLEAAYQKAGIPLPPGGVDALFRSRDKTAVIEPVQVEHQGQ